MQFPAFTRSVLGLAILFYLFELYCFPEFRIGNLFSSSEGGYGATACFLVGNASLPVELSAPVKRLTDEDVITCDFSRHTIGNIPDLSTSTLSFSEISFADSSSTPLQFAMTTFAISSFATKVPTGSSPLRVSEQRLDLYLAMEAGLRSEGGDSRDVSVVRKFLEFQVATIKSARGIYIADATQTSEYLLGDLSDMVQGDDIKALGDIMSLVSQG